MPTGEDVLGLVGVLVPRWNKKERGKKILEKN